MSSAIGAFAPAVETPERQQQPELESEPTSRPDPDARQSPTMQDVEDRLGPFNHASSLAPPPSLVVVISGPSGVGKDAVIACLRERRRDLHFVVTATSRPKRVGEVHGKDYFFVTRDQFELWLEEGDGLLEHALVYGDYKGIPRKQVEEALANDTDVVLRIDVQGSATIRRMMPSAVSIFLTAGSEAELVQRLVARKTENMDTVLARVTTAREEASRLTEFDYVVINKEGRLNETVLQIEAILHAEKSKVSRRLVQSPCED